MSKFHIALLLSAYTCFDTGTSDAQQLTATRVAPGQRVYVDGTLDEQAWSAAPVTDDFLEYEPVNGGTAPALRTSVRLLVDEQALTFGIRAWDTSPDRLRGSLARRDQVGTEHDFIGVWIDPTGQGQSAQFVRVNIAGVVSDGISRRNADDDLGPDFPIEAAVQLLPDGYSMEVRWPLSSLRFPYRDGKPWRAMIERSIPHADGKILLDVPLKTGAADYFSAMRPMARLGDTLDTVRDRRFVQLRPELTVRSGQGASLGMEINVRPRADWVFNATINPDFSQVEIDEPTSSSSRIALSLPEKRGFFLESSDVLGLPLAPFYSRTVADPAWGMRATWRSAAADATAMSLRDRDGGVVLRGGVYETATYTPTRESLASFVRARWHREHGVLGAFGSTRDYGSGAVNAVAGVDGQYSISAEQQAAWVLMGSRTTASFNDAGNVLTAARRGNYAWAQYKLNSDDWISDMSIKAVSPGFVNDNGFVPQTGVIDSSLNIIRRLGEQDLGVKLYDSEAYIRLQQIRTLADPLAGQRGGETVERRVRPGVWMFGPRQTRLWAEYGFDRQRGVNAGKLHDVSALHFGVDTRPTSWISSLGTEMSLGRRLDVEADRAARGGELLGTLKLRFKLPFGWASELDHRINRTWVNGADGRAAFSDTGWRWLGMLHFTPRDSVRLLAQNTAFARRPDTLAELEAFAERQVHRSLLYRHLWRHGRSLSLAWTADRSRNPDLLEKSVTAKFQWEM